MDVSQLYKQVGTPTTSCALPAPSRLLRSTPHAESGGRLLATIMSSADWINVEFDVSTSHNPPPTQHHGTRSLNRQDATSHTLSHRPERLPSAQDGPPGMTKVGPSQLTLAERARRDRRASDRGEPGPPRRGIRPSCSHRVSRRASSQPAGRRRCRASAARKSAG